jgi:hypothetical protein
MKRRPSRKPTRPRHRTDTYERAERIQKINSPQALRKEILLELEANGPAMFFPAARAMLEAYERWTPPTRQHRDTVEVFAPTLLPRHRQSSRVRGHDADVDEWVNGILHLCLYVDKLWVPDPAEIVAHSLGDVDGTFPLAIHEFLIANPQISIRAIRQIDKLQPLIDAGVITLYPPITTYSEYVSKGLFNAKRGFSDEELQHAWPELYVAEALLFAKTFDATYTALQRKEYRALQQAAAHIATAIGTTDAKVLTSLSHMKLPYFDRLTPEALVKARSSEAAFEDFRKLLRELAGTLPSTIDDPQFERDLKELEQDKVTPTLNALYDSITGTRSLRKNLSEAGIDFTAGFLAAAALTGDIGAKAIATGTVNVLMKVLIKILCARKPKRPAASTVYAFHTGRPITMKLDELHLRFNREP